MPIYRGSGGAGDSTTDATVTEVTQQAINAANSATQAATSASNAATSANNASTSSTAASTSATNAASSASSASTSASNASTSATASASSATSAAASASAAQTAQTAAETAETNAETAETNAESAQAYAEEWATKAEDSLISTAAGGDGSTDYSALHHAAKASTSETNAATSETNASNSATSASNSATASANSATAAATSATSASNSASAAATSATSAASSAASAASALDNFDDRYLGSKTADPALDNDGNALVVGALYFNSTDGVMKVYTASGWIAASSASVATMTKFNFTATGGQTVFSGADDNTETLSLTVGAEMVTLNGVVLEQGTDYTATSSAITLTTGATASDELNVYAFGNFQVADTVSASTGGTFTGAVTFDGGANFGDNDKAIFGAGSDLQIYHNGSHSYIDDAGTGNLYLRGNNLLLQKYTGETYLQGVPDGAVSLYYDNVPRISTTSTGIDVNGTVTADGLTVDGVTTVNGANLFVNNNVPTVRVTDTDLTNTYSEFRNVSGNAQIITRSNTSNGVFSIWGNDGSTFTQRLRIENNGDISFYEDTGTTPKLFWDASAERLGIGTTSPATPLNIEGTGKQRLRISSTNADEANINFLDGTNTFSVGIDGTDNKFKIAGGTSLQSDEKLTIDSSGNVGIGTSSPTTAFHVVGDNTRIERVDTDTNRTRNIFRVRHTTSGDMVDGFGATFAFEIEDATNAEEIGYITCERDGADDSGMMRFETSDGGLQDEAMRIDSVQNVMIQTTVRDPIGQDVNGLSVGDDTTGAGGKPGATQISSYRHPPLSLNRRNNDGAVVGIYQGSSFEGSISVSGTTVSYNGGHLARWSQSADRARINGLAKGTVLSNLDEMCEWKQAKFEYQALVSKAVEAQEAVLDEEGNVVEEAIEAQDAVYETRTIKQSYDGDASVGDVIDFEYKGETVQATVIFEDNEQLNRMKVSDVEGDPNVAGVFVNWDDDDNVNTADMNIAMTGDMVIRIAQGTTVARGDLLMSAGDGTAKPQDDDIVRSKTIAKVTSTHVSHTYDDGSYLVPCVLMAC